jgi:hypothetical protein
MLGPNLTHYGTNLFQTKKLIHEGGWKHTMGEPIFTKKVMYN